MASKTIAQLRADVTARLATLTGFRASLVSPDNFGRDADSLLGSPCFVVHPVTTTDLRQYRQRPAEGTLVETTLQVRYAFRLKPTDMAASYDLALGVEQQIVQKLMVYDATWPASYKVQYTSSTRETVPSGEWVIGTVEFRVVHTLPLQ